MKVGAAGSARRSGALGLLKSPATEWAALFTGDEWGRKKGSTWAAHDVDVGASFTTQDGGEDLRVGGRG